MDDRQKRKLTGLLSGLVEERLDAAGEQELQTLLEDERARELYLQYFDLHADLLLVAGETVVPETVASDESDASPSRAPGKTPSSSGWKWTAIALAGLALALLLSFGRGFQNSPETTEADVLAIVAATPETDERHARQPPTAGSTLSAGLLELQAGQVRKNATEDDLAELEALRERLFAVVKADVLKKNRARERRQAAIARRFLRQFATRAWRRPIADSELMGLMTLYQHSRSQRFSYDGSVKSALLAVLASPHFLYRSSLGDVGDSRSVRPLTSDELAGRLSFFLWASIPDQELLQLAANDKLREPEVLRHRAGTIRPHRPLEGRGTKRF